MTNETYKSKESIIIGHEKHIVEIESEQSYHIDNMKIYAPPGIYHPSKNSSSIFLLNFLKKIKITEKKVIEIGTGTGLIAIYLAKENNKVVATDISQLSCSTAFWNAKANEVEIEVLQSNLWAKIPSKIKFDVIIFNPPLLDKAIENNNEVSLCDPNGQITRKFLSGSKKHLNPFGEVYMLHSNISKELPEPWDKSHIVLDTMKKKEGTIYEIITFKDSVWK
jgi:Methylase of polypeptide chain release factors